MATKTFEDAMKELEQIVQELESGDLPLEKALKKFEDGVELSKFCSRKLDETEKKITILLEDQDKTLMEKPFHLQESAMKESDKSGTEEIHKQG
ncbi:MAG: exodeoxyribonuclease VII small subunit [Deltaproteobacteria bacterium]|nr:exodeoxyribonuclease VII small subunit [Deltaproteobacteria bacterium]MBW1992944.1 exodeoxyribonuclease VII small subunit [Deltaproteobacteria bacterium]MBW2152800.1 exodeoxyribonuclease VII small subunit [Deltaproteobacteria bacterium]